MLGSTTVVCVVDRNGILAQPFPSVRAGRTQCASVRIALMVLSESSAAAFNGR